MSTPNTSLAGKWSAEAKQHVEFHRKLLLRKRLCRWADPGAAYLPFIGDGDLAVELYRDRKIYGADLDPARIDVASSRLPGADLRVADCDIWTFPGLSDRIAIADFDAYVDPYTGFRAFLHHHGDKAPRSVWFFTDGRRQGMMRTGSWTKPDGTKLKLPAGDIRKVAAFNFYLSQHVFPWFDELISPEWRILERFRYLRSMMVYWGVAVERVKP